MTRLSSERCDFGSVRLYRISTALFSAAAKRLFLIDFPAYPRIIEHSIWVSIRAELGGLDLSYELRLPTAPGAEV
jgi:hypothetical protein